MGHTIKKKFLNKVKNALKINYKSNKNRLINNNLLSNILTDSYKKLEMSVNEFINGENSKLNHIKYGVRCLYLIYYNKKKNQNILSVCLIINGDKYSVHIPQNDNDPIFTVYPIEYYIIEYFSKFKNMDLSFDIMDGSINLTNKFKEFYPNKELHIKFKHNFPKYTEEKIHELLNKEVMRIKEPYNPTKKYICIYCYRMQSKYNILSICLFDSNKKIIIAWIHLNEVYGYNFTENYDNTDLICENITSINGKIINKNYCMKKIEFKQYFPPNSSNSSNINNSYI